MQDSLINFMNHLSPLAQMSLFVLMLCIVAFPVQIILLWCLRSITSANRQKQAHNKALTQRKNSQPGGPVFVRQTDIVENMSREDQTKHAQALQLIEQNNIIAAATLLEEIKFQRKAIDLLEKSGHIEEACQMLFRLSAPNRAAILYDRNNMPEKSIPIYLKLEMFKEAGNGYQKLSMQDYRYLYNAAQCFEKAQLPEEALNCFMNVGAYNDGLNLAPKLFQYEKILLSFLRDRLVSQQFLNLNSLASIEGFIKNIPFYPMILNTILEWIRLAPNKMPYLIIFQRCLEKKGLFLYLIQRSDQFLQKLLLQEVLLLNDYLHPYALQIAADFEKIGAKGEATLCALLFNFSSEAIEYLAKQETPASLSTLIQQIPLFKSIILPMHPDTSDSNLLGAWLKEINKELKEALDAKKAWSDIERKSASKTSLSA